MFRRLLLTALVAGVVSGLVITAIQHFTTTPLIHQAEKFEHASSGHSHSHKTDDATVGHDHGEGAWAPSDGAERLFFTSLTNLIAGVAFGLLLVACFALHGRELDGRRGVLWGLGGFAVFALAPGLGLPPEVPGSMTAALIDRQGWWFAAALATAAGLALLVFGKKPVLIVLGIVVLAAPHVIGAPRPDAATGGAVPPELAAHFVAASLVTSAVFWAVLGWTSGTVYRRLGRAEAPTE